MDAAIGAVPRGERWIGKGGAAPICLKQSFINRPLNSGAEFGRSFVRFVHKNAPISSATQVMYQHEREML
jgi:hypothetical protein